METTDQTLQRKTIRLTPEETKKAIIYYLNNASFDYTRKKAGKEFSEKELDTQICTGSENSVEFNKYGAAKVTTHYL